MISFHKHKVAALLLLAATLSWQANMALMPCLCSDSTDSPASSGTSCDACCVCGDSPQEVSNTDLANGTQDCSTNHHSDSDVEEVSTVPSSNHSDSHNHFGCIHTGERINTGAVSETTISTQNEQTSVEFTQLKLFDSDNLSQYGQYGNFYAPIVVPPALYARTLPLLI